MIIGHHIIIAAYGFWLPNDPRGSWSDEVWSPKLRQAGPATKVQTHRSVARRTHSHSTRIQAKQHLQYPVVQFNPVQVEAIAAGFADVADKLEIIVHACAVLPDHTHLVVRRHRLDARTLSGVFKRAGTRGLNVVGIHPLKDYRMSNRRVPSPWAADGWQVFLNSDREMRRAIQYVDDNPVEAGRPSQHWSFVVPRED